MPSKRWENSRKREQSWKNGTIPHWVDGWTAEGGDENPDKSRLSDLENEFRQLREKAFRTFAMDDFFKKLDFSGDRKKLSKILVDLPCDLFSSESLLRTLNLNYPELNNFEKAALNWWYFDAKRRVSQ